MLLFIILSYSDFLFVLLNLIYEPVFSFSSRVFLKLSFWRWHLHGKLSKQILFFQSNLATIDLLCLHQTTGATVKFSNVSYINAVLATKPPTFIFTLLAVLGEEMCYRANVYSDMFCKLFGSVKSLIALFQAERHYDTVNIGCQISFS